METEDLKAGKKLKSTPTAEPTITNIEQLEQPKKELTKESSNALVIIQ